ncbi:MAG: SDR family NAD(P)-dependent oxidoreductase, partial [Akkermansiaceae bacterium]
MNELFNIEGKVIAITGATGILAGDLARYLLSQGAKVAILSRSADKVAAAVEEAKSISPHVMGAACDVTSQSDVQAAHDAILTHFGAVDALINGAGGNMPGATIGPDADLFSLDINDYASVMNLNLQGTLIPSMVFGKTFAK